MRPSATVHLKLASTSPRRLHNPRHHHLLYISTHCRQPLRPPLPFRDYELHPPRARDPPDPSSDELRTPLSQRSSVQPSDDHEPRRLRLNLATEASRSSPTSTRQHRAAAESPARLSVALLLSPSLSCSRPVPEHASDQIRRRARPAPIAEHATLHHQRPTPPSSPPPRPPPRDHRCPSSTTLPATSFGESVLPLAATTTAVPMPPPPRLIAATLLNSAASHSPHISRSTEPRRLFVAMCRSSSAAHCS